MPKTRVVDKVLFCLQEAAAEDGGYIACAGEPGWVHMRALNDICFSYGQRIHELRAEGHEIEKRTCKGVVYYRLRRSDDKVSKT